MRYLELPREALNDGQAFEFFRAWVSGENINFVSAGNIFQDAGYIGIFLADALRHLIASSDVSDVEKNRQMQRALEAFSAEFDSPGRD